MSNARSKLRWDDKRPCVWCTQPIKKGDKIVAIVQGRAGSNHYDNTISRSGLGHKPVPVLHLECAVAMEVIEDDE